MKTAENFTSPLLIAQNVNDRITSYPHNVKWFNRTSSKIKEFISIPGEMRHAIHLVKSVKDELIRKYIEWIKVLAN